MFRNQDRGPGNPGRAAAGPDRLREQAAILQRFEEGAAVSGTLLPGLPPSMMQVLGSSEGGEPVVRTATTVVWDGQKAVDFSVRGARLLALQIER